MHLCPCFAGARQALEQKLLRLAGTNGCIKAGELVLALRQVSPAHHQGMRGILTLAYQGICSQAYPGRATVGPVRPDHVYQ